MKWKQPEPSKVILWIILSILAYVIFLFLTSCIGCKPSLIDYIIKITILTFLFTSLTYGLISSVMWIISKVKSR